MADLGKVGITYFSGGYIAGKTYEPLVVIKYTDGGTYMSILPTVGHLPTDTTYWAVLVPPIEASSIDYTPLAGGVITNVTVQGAIEQADSLKQNKSSMVGTNVNNANTYPNSALLYALNDGLTKIIGSITLTAGYTTGELMVRQSKNTVIVSGVASRIDGGVIGSTQIKLGTITGVSLPQVILRGVSGCSDVAYTVGVKTGFQYMGLDGSIYLWNFDSYTKAISFNFQYIV